MVKINNVYFSYEKNDKQILRGLNLDIKKGECVLLCGKSGCGKSTTLKLINNLIPTYFENCQLEGDVLLKGNQISNKKTYEISSIVGSVFQNPKSQFFYLDSTSELLFGLENSGVKKEMIKERYIKTVEELKIKNLLGKNVLNLSGGEKQTIAFSSVYITNPDILVLDEPSANIDHASINKLVEIIRQSKKLGKTIIIAEHRFFYLKNLVDTVYLIDNGVVAKKFNANQFFKFSNNYLANMNLRAISDTLKIEKNSTSNKNKYFNISELNYAYGKHKVLNNVNFSIDKNEVLAITGKNGCGKTTLLNILSGLIKPKKCNIEINNCKVKSKNLRKHIYYVMQDTNYQLFSESVFKECSLSSKKSTNQINTLLKDLNLFEKKDSHPMSLSGGEKQRVAIASALASNKEILLFDEPTSGLDLLNMKSFAKLIEKIKKDRIIIIVTHDYELINSCCSSYIDLMECKK